MYLFRSFEVRLFIIFHLGAFMKKIALFIVILSALSTTTNAQWYYQNSGTTNDLAHVFFVDENIGYMVGGFNMFKTTDGGNLWTSISTIDSVGVQDLFFINAQIGWFVFQDYPNYSGGVFKTTNGGITWNLQMTTVQDMNMLSIQFVDSLNGFCLGDYSMAGGRLYKTIDGGQTWSYTLTSINLAEGLYFIDKYTGWVAGGTIEKTTDSGVTWTVQLNIDPKYFSYIQFVNNNTGWAFSRGYWQETQIYKTTNGGQSWYLQTDFPFRRICFVDESYGWALTTNAIYRTTDGGDIWGLQYVDTLNTLYDMFFINQNKGWVIGENGTILTTNNGGIPVELLSFTSFVIDCKVTLNWQTATETNNQGFLIERRKTLDERREEWQNIGFVNGNGTATEIQSYLFVDKDLQTGRYEYRLKQIDFDGTFEYSKTIEVEIGTPTKFSLEQNYPNPFNPRTIIRYNIPNVISIPTSRERNLFVSLKIYDVLGNEIATLVNEEKPAGSYEVEFNLPAGRQGTASGIKNPASGIYFYQLEAGDYFETKKMVLMK